MKAILTIMLAMSSFAVSSQTLQKKFTWKSNLISNAKISWADMDNDSLLDVVIIAKTGNQSSQLQIYQNKQTAFLAMPTIPIDMIVNNYELVDLNSDNHVDVVINGSGATSSSIVLINNTHFQFTGVALNLPEGDITCQAWADFNMDGRVDLIAGGQNFLRLTQQTSTGFVTKFDSTGLNVLSIITGDFNKDGKIDFVASGSQSSKSFTTFFKNNGSFKFKRVNIAKPLNGLLSIADFNHDGLFDVVVSGKNFNQADRIYYYRNSVNKFSLTDSLSDYQPGEILLADFKSTGISQTSYLGKNTDGKKVNFLRDTAGVFTLLDTTQLAVQRWGDYDRDGDLDLLQVKDSASYQVFQLLENKTVTKNRPPQRSGITFTVTVYGKSIIYWDNAKDDLTKSPALSYDVMVTKPDAGSSIKIAANFDRANRKGLLVSHGNRLTSNFTLIPGPWEPFDYIVQPLDNAFNGGDINHCYGGSSRPGPCQVTEKFVQACNNNVSTPKLEQSEPAYWFSFNDGFKGLSTSLTLTSNQPDTVISVIYRPTGCSVVTANIVQTNQSLVVESAAKFVCAGKQIRLGIKAGWQKVLWHYQGNTSTADSISTTVNAATQITVEASTGSCSYKKDFNLRISSPNLAVDNDHLIIRQGESVQLSASGAGKYLWLPATYLDNNQVPNPIASPLKSISYEVTGSDSISCFQKATVQVDVINTGFLPNLFTPNGDGKNDELRVLGLASPTEFQFTVYNREGNVVYETTDWQQASSTGWNGQRAGAAQPSGLYYWKVTGTQSDGQPVLINGKHNGSVLLVR